MEEIMAALLRIATALEQANEMTRGWIAINKEWQSQRIAIDDMHVEWIDWNKQVKREEMEQRRDEIAASLELARAHQECMIAIQEEAFRVSPPVIGKEQT